MALRPEDLMPELQEKLGLKPSARMKMEDIRRWAIRVLAEMGELSQSDRSRVLTHAQKTNKV